MTFVTICTRPFGLLVNTPNGAFNSRRSLLYLGLIRYRAVIYAARGGLMSRKYRSKTKNPSSRRFPWLWLAVSVAVLLIVAGLVVTWTGPKTASAPGTLTGGQAKSAPAAPQSTGDGGPRLAVDQAVIDEGNIKPEIRKSKKN